MRVRIFQPFQKIWTPRTPDSGYDSFGLTMPPNPIVLAPLIPESPQTPETIGASLSLVSGAYFAATVITGGAGAVGCSTKFVSGTYTA